MTRPYRAQRFERWLTEAQPGQGFVYHRGELARDRVTDKVLDALANRVQECSTRSYDLVSKCGHVRGRLDGTGILEVVTQKQQSETVYIARMMRRLGDMK